MSAAPRPVDYIPTGLLVAAIVANIVADRRGTGTICSTTRPIWGLHTMSGKVRVIVTYGTFTSWFIPHYPKGNTP